MGSCGRISLELSTSATAETVLGLFLVEFAKHGRFTDSSVYLFGCLHDAVR